MNNGSSFQFLLTSLLGYFLGSEWFSNNKTTLNDSCSWDIRFPSALPCFIVTPTHHSSILQMLQFFFLVWCSQILVFNRRNQMFPAKLFCHLLSTKQTDDVRSWQLKTVDHSATHSIESWLRETENKMADTACLIFGLHAQTARCTFLIDPSELDYRGWALLHAKGLAKSILDAQLLRYKQ